MVRLEKPGQRYIRCAGSLGWGLPGTLGVKAALPDKPVVGFTGDAGFYYHIGELETAVRNGLNAVMSSTTTIRGGVGETSPFEHSVSFAKVGGGLRLLRHPRRAAGRDSPAPGQGAGVGPAGGGRGGQRHQRAGKARLVAGRNGALSPSLPVECWFLSFAGGVEKVRRGEACLAPTNSRASGNVTGASSVPRVGPSPLWGEGIVLGGRRERLRIT